MKSSDATDLIKKAFTTSQKPVKWADLGCGAGTFTKALAEVLPAGSEIFAIDKTTQVVEEVGKDIKINFQKADFEKDALLLPELDGILIANALHYVKEKNSFLDKIQKHLRTSGALLIIEYNTETSNPWVPYPITFNKLKNLMLQAGFTSVEKMAERPSVYNNGTIYSCLVKRH